MEIHESAEDYLETILILGERTGHVRSIDIATEMNYTKPSISVAMKKLRANGYIEVDDFFIALGVNEKTAAKDACKMEHDLSEETFEKIRVLGPSLGKYLHQD